MWSGLGMIATWCWSWPCSALRAESENSGLWTGQEREKGSAQLHSSVGEKLETTSSFTFTYFSCLYIIQYLFTVTYKFLNQLIFIFFISDLSELKNMFFITKKIKIPFMREMRDVSNFELITYYVIFINLKKYNYLSLKKLMSTFSRWRCGWFLCLYICTMPRRNSVWSFLT